MPEDLIAYAWSAPMRDLAQKLNMSDVGLRKLLAGYLPREQSSPQVRLG
jgi:hypothetical protein